MCGARYPDPRPLRTFANIRYGLYGTSHIIHILHLFFFLRLIVLYPSEYWLRYYDVKSYILILDFRDTFFQQQPFSAFGAYPIRHARYDLHLFAENWAVKNIGKCVYNSLWIGRCFSKQSLQDIRAQAVICSGSTLGSFLGIDHYVATMLTWMDKVQCWLKGNSLIVHTLLLCRTCHICVLYG